jgi:hypothetical protein
VHRTSRFSHHRLFLCVAGALLLAAGVCAQQSSPGSGSEATPGQTKESPKKSKKKPKKAEAQATATAAPSSQNITSAWSSLLHNVVPATEPSKTVEVAQQPVQHLAAGDFLDHFYLESRTEYWFDRVSFTQHPTSTGVIDVPPTGTANPNGIPDPAVFQPNTHEMYSFLHVGTHGWLSDRLNTDFTVRYEQDLTHVNAGAPGQTLVNTFNGNRLVELLTGYVEINGLPSDGFFAGSSLRLGRQAVYGAELAEFDGASFAFNRPNYSVSVFGGRRFSYFSDPDQRGIGGVNFLYHINGNSSFEYEGLFYIKGTNTFTYRRSFRNLLFNTHFRMVGSYPVDYAATAIWTPAGGKSTVILGFKQKITNKDYFYDYTLNARDLDPHNTLLRLYLGPRSPYSQFVIDVRRTFTPRIQLGGGVWIRRLNDSNDQGPFDTSFQDYHVNAQFTPWRAISTDFGFDEHDSDRRSPFPSTTFNDIIHAGETHVRDFTFELGRSFAEGRVNLRAGGFYRVFDFQDRFLFIDHAHDEGLLGGAQFKLDPRTQIYVDYDLDTDLAIFAPDIRHAQQLRVGLAWRY